MSETHRDPAVTGTRNRTGARRTVPINKDYLLTFKPKRKRAQTSPSSSILFATAEQPNSDMEEKEKAALAIMELCQKKTQERKSAAISKESTKTYQRLELRKQERQKRGITSTPHCGGERHHSVVSSIYDLQFLISPCVKKDCGCRLLHCPLCDADFFMPVKYRSTLWRHVLTHEKYSVKFENVRCCLCRLKCSGCLISHYHCPLCFQRIIKRSKFVHHLKSHEREYGQSFRIETRNPGSVTTEGVDILEDEVEVQKGAPIRSVDLVTVRCSSNVEDQIEVEESMMVSEEVIEANNDTDSRIVMMDQEVLVTSMEGDDLDTSDDVEDAMITTEEVVEATDDAVVVDNSVGSIVVLAPEAVSTSVESNDVESAIVAEPIEMVDASSSSLPEGTIVDQVVDNEQMEQQILLETSNGPVVIVLRTVPETTSVICSEDATAAETLSSERATDTVQDGVFLQDTIMTCDVAETEGNDQFTVLTSLAPNLEATGGAANSEPSELRKGSISIKDLNELERFALENYFSEDKNKPFEMQVRVTANGEQEYPCKLCDVVKQSRHAIYRHYRRDHCEKRFMCPKCPVRYAQFTDLKRHMGSCRGKVAEDPLRDVLDPMCPICGTKYASKKSLRIHYKDHHCGPDNTVYKCHICDREFSVKRYLLSHLKRHTSDRKYKCDTCGKCFKQRTHLKEHQLVHVSKDDRNDRFVCLQCGKRFMRQQILDDHMHLHRDEKPHACSQCSKAFAGRCALSKHIKTVHDTPAYMCDMCRKCFVYKHLLKSHKEKCNLDKAEVVANKTTPEEGNESGQFYQCSVCEATFQRWGHIVEHMLQHETDVTGVDVSLMSSGEVAGPVDVCDGRTNDNSPRDRGTYSHNELEDASPDVSQYLKQLSPTKSRLSVESGATQVDLLQLL